MCFQVVYVHSIRIVLFHLFNTATFMDLMKSPDALSVIGSSQCTLICVFYNDTSVADFLQTMK